MLHTALIVNVDGEIALRADEDTFVNLPLSQQRPCMCDEYPSAWIFQGPSEEEARGYMHVFTSLTRNE
eukprot:4001497-Pyramimonas_sp.AAC.1